MKTIRIIDEMQALNLDPIKAFYEQIEKATAEEKSAMELAGFSTGGMNVPSEVLKCKGKVYHVSEIKKICSRYDFKFMSPTKYKGKTPVLLGANIANFCKEKNISMYGKGSTRFSLLAPREDFHVFRTTWDDPILFYNIVGDYYEVVDKWGNDINFGRRLLSIGRLFISHSLWKISPPMTATLQTATLLCLWGIIYLLSLIPALNGGWARNLGIAAIINFLILWPILEYFDRRSNWQETDVEIRNKR